VTKSPEDPVDSSDTSFQQIFAELKLLARKHMAGERGDHTLQVTALVNEARLRLRDQVDEVREKRGRFFLAAAESMRRILIEHARSRGRQKGGGRLDELPLDLALAAETIDLDQAIAIDEAIEKLRAESERAAELARLRFFAGLTEIEAASVLEISERSARREWTFARAYLYNALSR